MVEIKLDYLHNSILAHSRHHTTGGVVCALPQISQYVVAGIFFPTQYPAKLDRPAKTITITIKINFFITCLSKYPLDYSNKPDNKNT